MRNSIYILLTGWVAGIMLFSGCAQSFLKINPALDTDPLIMYGGTPERSFYYNFPITDSVRLVWSGGTNGSYAASSVSFYDKYIFVNDLSGRVTCFDLFTGKKAGQLKNKGAIYSTAYVDRFFIVYISAVNDENKSVVSYFDFINNKEIEAIELVGRALTEMIVDNGFIYVCMENGRVYKLDMKGNIKWELKTKERIHSSPALSSGRLYFGNDKGELLSVDAANGDMIYRKKIGETFAGGSSISGDKLYIGSNDGSLYCIDYLTGNVNWEYSSSSRIIMTPAYDDNNVYAGNLSGEFFSLNKTTGKLNWTKKLGTLFNTAPTVTSNYLIIPDQFKRVYFADKETGEVKKFIEVDNRIKLTPTIINQKFLIIGYDNGVLNVYETL